MRQKAAPAVSNRTAIVSLAFAMCSMALGVGFIIPLLPIYAETFGASGLWIGAVFGAHPFVRAMCMLFFGSLADYTSKKSLISYGLVGYILVALGFVFASQIYHLLILRMLQGTFSALIAPVARAYAGEISAHGKEGRDMAILYFGFFAGLGVGPLIGGVFADWLGFTAPFYAMSVLSIVALTVLLVFVPHRPPAHTKRGSIFELFRESFYVLTDDIVRGIVSIRSAVALGRGMYSTVLPLFGQLILGLSATQVGFIVSVRALVAAGLQSFCGPLADRLNRKWLVVLGFGLTPVVFLLVPFSHAVWHLALISALLGISMAISIPSVEAIAVEQGRIFRMGRIMGMVQMTQSFATGIGGVVAGSALDAFGMRNVFLVAALLSVCGILVALWFFRNYTPPWVETEC